MMPFSRTIGSTKGCHVLRGPGPDLRQSEQLLSHFATGRPKTVGSEARLQQVIGVLHQRPVLVLDRTANPADDNSLPRPNGVVQPRSNPTFQSGRISDQATVNGRFQAPRVTVAADGKRGIAELKEAEVHSNLASRVSLSPALS